MAYLHCWRWIRTWILTWILVRCRIFSTGLDSDSDTLIGMYVIGTEICHWDGDPSLKWVTIHERNLSLNLCSGTTSA